MVVIKTQGISRTKFQILIFLLFLVMLSKHEKKLMIETRKNSKKTKIAKPNHESEEEFPQFLAAKLLNPVSNVKKKSISFFTYQKYHCFKIRTDF